MDTLHSVLRSIRGETKSETKSKTKSKTRSQRDHLTVFRDFLGHLDRAGRKPRAGGDKAPRDKSVKPSKFTKPASRRAAPR